MKQAILQTGTIRPRSHLHAGAYALLIAALGCVQHQQGTARPNGSAARVEAVGVRVFLGATDSNRAAQPNLRIDVTSVLPVTESGRAAVEPFIAADPRDSTRLIISVSEIVPAHGIMARAFVSSDGGNAWESVELPEMRAATDSGRLILGLDTWLDYAADGTAYYNALGRLAPGERTRTDSWGRNPIFVYRSTDRGASWSGPAIIRSRSFDAPKVASGLGTGVIINATVSGTDTAARPPRGSTEQIAVLRSDDGARSFRAAAFLGPDELGRNPLNPAFLPDGTLLVPWFDHAIFGDSGAIQHVNFSRIWVARSIDGGTTFDTPRFVADVGRMGFPAVLRLAVDTWASSKFRGRAYVAWNGGTTQHADLSVVYSSDGGQRWSSPAKVSRPGGHSAVFTAISAAPDGTVGALWGEHEADALSTPCWQMFFAASVDGGATFSQPHQLTTAPVCPNAPGNRTITYPAVGRTDTVSSAWPHGGHYIGLAASADGVFHPAWSDTRDGTFRTYTARIRVRK
jgi:hypothetical protein